MLTELRDWLITALTMPEAVCGLPEEQGRVLSTLARAVDARKMVDLGTFTGYSSIAMALATADDAQVICCEPDAVYAQHARDWWHKAACANKMVMHEIDGETLMSNLLTEGGAGQYDMIFVDAGNRERYGAMHELAMQLVHVGGVVVYYDTLWPADRVLQHSYYPDMRNFNFRLAEARSPGARRSGAEKSTWSPSCCCWPSGLAASRVKVRFAEAVSSRRWASEAARLAGMATV